MTEMRADCGPWNLAGTVTAGDPFPDLRPDAEAPATPGLSQNRLCDCVLIGDIWSRADSDRRRLSRRLSE